MKITIVKAPTPEDLMLFKRCVWVTTGKIEAPGKGPSPKLLRKVLAARHSPIRVLNFAFLLEGIPSNISTHLARHVHATPFIASLRNDRQDRMDGDLAPRNTPVDMIYYVNAEELMVIANKRLCLLAAEKTREAVQGMCDLAETVMPELRGLLVPMCEYGRCHEIHPCGRYDNGGTA